MASRAERALAYVTSTARMVHRQPGLGPQKQKRPMSRFLPLARSNVGRRVSDRRKRRWNSNSKRNLRTRQRANSKFDGPRLDPKPCGQKANRSRGDTPPKINRASQESEPMALVTYIGSACQTMAGRDVGNRQASNTRTMVMVTSTILGPLQHARSTQAIVLAVQSSCR